MRFLNDQSVPNSNFRAKQYIFIYIYFILSHLPNIFLSFLNPNLQVRIKSPNFGFLIYIFVLYFLYYHKMHTQ
jgi:hypothetical protein